MSDTLVGYLYCTGVETAESVIKQTMQRAWSFDDSTLCYRRPHLMRQTHVPVVKYFFQFSN